MRVRTYVDDIVGLNHLYYTADLPSRPASHRPRPLLVSPPKCNTAGCIFEYQDILEWPRCGMTDGAGLGVESLDGSSEVLAVAFGRQKGGFRRVPKRAPSERSEGIHDSSAACASISSLVSCSTSLARDEEGASLGRFWLAGLSGHVGACFG